jgi:predicted DCC family thiol-disulfide oxidoreductase YuxK
MTPPLRYPLTIYYDASCPLCTAEMHTLLRHDAAGELRLIDCSAANFSDAETAAAGITQAAMMRRIHARDASGRWLQGIAVFEAAYRSVGIAWLAGLFGNARLQPILARSYGWVADHRMLVSRLGISGLFGWCVECLAQRAQRRAARCNASGCDAAGDAPGTASERPRG